MAQGSVVIFEEFTLDVGTKVHNLDTDSHKISLHNVLPATDTASPNYSDFTGTEVSGTNYTSTGAAATFAYTEAGGTGTMTLSTDVTWTANAAGPSDIKYGVIYSTTATGAACGTIDMTTDAGTTPLDLADGDIVIQAGTAFTIAKV